MKMKCASSCRTGKSSFLGIGKRALKFVSRIHLNTYITLREYSENMYGDTINNDKVAAVGRNTNAAFVVVNGKLQDVSYPMPALIYTFLHLFV